MLETLISVGVGGVIGVAGTVAREFMHTRRERRMHREKEALSIARRVLALAHEAWESAREYRDSSLGMDGYRTVMQRNAEARNQLLIAMDELALLIPDMGRKRLHSSTVPASIQKHWLRVSILS
jgi:hypothetical protein